MIHSAVNGGREDVVLFAGNGCTGAIEKVTRLLDLQRRPDSTAKLGCKYPGCQRRFESKIAYQLHTRTHGDAWVAQDPGPSKTCRIKPSTLKGKNRPVVFHGPMEHHSNILMWRECDVDVESVRPSPEGDGLDLDYLETLLKKYRGRALVIGSFSAASNVTGKMPHKAHCF